MKSRGRRNSWRNLLVKRIKNWNGSRSTARPRISAGASLRYAELVYYGLWFAPLRKRSTDFQRRATALTAPWLNLEGS